MTAILALVMKNWRLLALGALLALLGLQEVRVNRAQTQTARARAELAGDRATYALARATQEKAARAEETRRDVEKEKVIHDAQEQTAAAQAAARDAGRAAAGLRQQVASLIASRRSTPNPGAASGSAPADGSGDLLNLVFAGMGDVAGELAAEADRRGIAGAACQRAYESLTAVQPAS